MPLFLLWINVALELALLASLIARRRLQHCFTLPVLAAAWVTADLVVGLSPDSNTWSFWIAKELVHALLALAVGLELSCRLLLAVPLGHLAVQRWLLGLMLFAVALATTAPAGPANVTLLPRLLAALAWLYTGLAVVMARYSIPIDRLHGAVLATLSPYCILYWLTWSRTGSDTAVAGLVNPAAFVAVLGALVWAAWRDAPEPPVELEIVKLVRPWMR